ncbi:MAG TPA: thiamine pyrophosphate-dependent enzyme [Bdellovibrionota bacterium]|nr:thiamine pyrophosphate-dependent enzyme [Bdellovibrionota bacterium]
MLEKNKFIENVVCPYNAQTASEGLPADEALARSLVPPGTAELRDFSYVSSELPIFISDKCVGCMACVIECPDTALLAKVVKEKDLSACPTEQKELYVKTTKYWTSYEKKGLEPGLFTISIDPTKCKGCGECVLVCGEHAALKMVQKDEKLVEDTKNGLKFFKSLPPTSKEFINEKLLVDFMLSPDALLYTGGAGSCMGCGEGTALRMMLAASGFVYGPHSLGIVASTGCNTVFGSTYPYNPFLVSWTNSLFENSCAVAMGIRARWDQMGLQKKKIWVVGGDGALFDIGFQSLSRMLMSGMDINVLVLDTQVYSNTGGQASTATFLSQNAKMATHGEYFPGKKEYRKELSNIALMHAGVFVSQTVCSFPNHFYSAIMQANEYPGPALVNVYAPCPPEHGIADNAAFDQSKLAVMSRTFPLMVYDPRKGSRFKERLSLKGNPHADQDWYHHPTTKEAVDFISFARTEGRFAKQFDKAGTPSLVLQKAQAERLENWHLLQELAGLAGR